MSSPLKTVLPLLLGVSPLLIAAAPAPTATQFTCGLDPAEPDARTEAELTASIAESPTQTAQQRLIAHPIVTSLQALVTSEQEWNSFLAQAVDAARGYWRENPNYSLQFATEAAEQARCMALNGELSDELAKENAGLKGFAKETPQGDVIVPPSEIADDLPIVEPAAGGAPPAERVEPTSVEAEPTEAEPTEAEPANLEAESAAESVLPVEAAAPTPTLPSGSTLVPAPPFVDAIAAPNTDPNNYIPSSQSPTPFDGTMPDSLQALPDGSYRYISGRYENRAYSDDVLRASGRSIFLLTKTGNGVVGRLMPQLGEPGVCVDGTLSGNTILGTAYTETAAEAVTATEAVNKEAAESTGEYVALGETGLQVRAGVTLGEQTLYSDALLNLDDFSRINAGSAIAPTACLSIPTMPTEPQAPTEGTIEASDTAENRASLPAQ